MIDGRLPSLRSRPTVPRSTQSLPIKCRPTHLMPFMGNIVLSDVGLWIGIVKKHKTTGYLGIVSGIY